MSDFSATLKHLKPVWKYDPFNTWAKGIMASFRTCYDTFILLWLLFSFNKTKKYTFHFSLASRSVSLTTPTNIIDEHYLRAIKTRYLWQTRVHIQPLPSPPTTNERPRKYFTFLYNIFILQTEIILRNSQSEEGKYIYGNIKGR